MTNKELKAAISYYETDTVQGRQATLLEAARELLQLKDGTHPDMVLVPRVTMLHARHYLDGVARDAYDSSEVCEIIYNIDKAIINAVQKGSNND